MLAPLPIIAGLTVALVGALTAGFSGSAAAGAAPDAASTTITFAPAVDKHTGEGARAIATADFDGDGQLDLAVANAEAKHGLDPSRSSGRHVRASKGAGGRR